MAKIKKFVTKQNLQNVRVLIDDPEIAQRFFQTREIRDVLHSGRQGFLVAGSPALVNDTEVLIEILDVNGETVFVSAVRNYAEGQARFISIEVYEDTPPGPATLTILGESSVDENGNPVPDVWKGSYNIKLTRQIQIDPLRTNDSKIRVFRSPELNVSEVLAPFRKSVTGSLTAVPGTGSATGNTLIRTINPDSFEENIYTIHTPSTPISKSMEGGSFTASLDITGFSGTFTSSISSVINDTTFQVNPGLVNASGTLFLPFVATNFTISFQDDTQFSTTTLTRSFADVELLNLKTFSGDIARVKLFARSIDSDADFEPVADQRLESQEITQVSSSVLGPATMMGNFFAQEVINQFWVGGTISQSVVPPYRSDVGLVTLSRNTTRLINSMFISNAPQLRAGSGSTGAPQLFMGLTGSVDLPFIEDLEYTFGMSALCLKDNDAFAGKLEVYLSGSAFPSVNPLGVKIAELTSPVGELRNLQRDLEVNFVPATTGRAKLNLAITAGEWYINELAIFSSTETGFNPDNAEFLIPIFGHRFEQLQFKAQLFDPNNNQFPDEIFSDIVFFDGGNLLIRGTDHRMEGTLTVSPSGSFGVKITSTGYQLEDGTFQSGSAVIIGEGRFFHSGTAFLIAEDPQGDPKLSMGDKLKAFVDPVTGEFILQIVGTILVGSGSIFTDIRSLLPRSPTDDFFHRIRGFNLDFFDLLGRKAITAGNVSSENEATFVSAEQIARMGKYTRGTIPRTVPTNSPLIVSGVTSSLDPFGATTVSSSIAVSGTIDLPENVLIWNNSLYGNLSVDVDEIILTAGSGAYQVDLELIVDTSWVGFSSGTNPGVGSEQLNLTGTRVVQTLALDENFFITQTGSFSPDPYISYPIHIPEERPAGFNTLFVVVRLDVTTTQAAS